MRFIAILLIFGFMGMIIFGFMPMNHDTHHAMGDSHAPVCPIGALVNASCANGLPMAVLHISALQQFLNSPVTSIFFAFAFMVLAVFAYAVYEPKNSLLALFHFARTLSERNLFRPSIEKVRSWLSLFENSPAFV